LKNYEDPQRHFEQSMERSAKKYVDGLERAGLEPNAKLTRVMAERALIEAREDYNRRAAETRHHNIGVIVGNHNRRMNEIKRSGHKLRLWTCPPIAALFGFMAWYSFSHPGAAGIIMGVVYVFGALAFLAMLVLGAIFDRPKGES
jgi:hypothetical protein